MIVTAANQAGSAQAASARSAPVGATPPRASVVRSRLRRALSISRRASRIASLLHVDGYVFEFAAPTAGTLTVSWSYRARDHQATLVARRRIRFITGQSTRLQLPLTRAGVRVLERSHPSNADGQGRVHPARRTSGDCNPDGHDPPLTAGPPTGMDAQAARRSASGGAAKNAPPPSPLS